MHPAGSLIVFTTLSGIGLGLMALLGLGVGPSGMGFAWTSAILAYGLTGFGLLSSVLHLRRPDRAWRAFSQWQSSWLSREGVLAVATLAVFGVYCLVWLFGGVRTVFLGIPAAVLASITVYCTAMIYAQLTTVPQWKTWLTPAAFMSFALAGSLLVLTLLLTVFPPRTTGLGWLALVALIAAWIFKILWWQRAANATLESAGSDTAAATGLGHLGSVRAFEPPHTGSNYLLREMVFEVGRKRAGALRKLAIGAGAILPAVLLALSVLTGMAAVAGPLLMFAVISHVIGMMAERWLFFAEAKHAVASYYGKA